MNYINLAMDNMQQIFKYCRKSEQYNNWKGLYYNSLLSDFQRSRTFIRKLRGLIENGYNSCQLPVRHYSYYSWYNYQKPYADNYPLLHYNQSYHMNTYIRIYCINTGNQINNLNITNCCINNANGGIFNIDNNCNAMIQLNVLKWDICKYIRYTLDGSIPNENSMFVTQNKNVINVTKSTTVQARCQYNNTQLDPQITTTYFELL